MNNIIILCVIALLIESLAETSKFVFKEEKKINIASMLALIFGMVICVSADINIFALLNISLSFPIIGNILTGLLVARGSNFTHDLLGKLNHLSDFNYSNTNIPDITIKPDIDPKFDDKTVLEDEHSINTNTI